MGGTGCNWVYGLNGKTFFDLCEDYGNFVKVLVG